MIDASIETLSSLTSKIYAHLHTNLSQYPSASKVAITEDYIGEWLGQPRKNEVKGPPSSFDVFIWRTMYVRQSILDMSELLDFTKAIPFKGYRGDPSSQLKFINWVYLNRIYEFQERLYQFHIAAVNLLPKKNRAGIRMNKKQFRTAFLETLKPAVDQRDLWVHDSEPEHLKYGRLSSLELFSRIYVIDASGKKLANILKREARRLFQEEKDKLFRSLVQNDPVFTTLANRVVKHSMSFSGAELMKRLG